MNWHAANFMQTEKLKKQKAIANFVEKWSKVESTVKDASGIEDNNVSFFDILHEIADLGKLASSTIDKLHDLRKLRNDVMHNPDNINQKQLDKSLKDLASVKTALDNNLKK